MKLSLAVLALGLTPAFSYLATLEKATAAKGEAQYGSGSSGIRNYLDALATSPATSPSGGGLTSYLDALPKNTAPSVSGNGMQSYAESLNKAGSVAQPVVAAAAPKAVAPAPTSFAAAGNVATTSISYLQAISTNASPVSGSGMRGYLDALPASPSAVRGAGITTYLDALPRGAAVSGAGLKTYIDALSPTSSVFSKAAYTPSSSAETPFAMGSISGAFDFSFDVDESIMKQISAASGRKIVLSGRIESVSYN